ncbi:MAG TPA: glycosyltransferase family 2 protein [Fimbriimonas sp.]
MPMPFETERTRAHEMHESRMPIVSVIVAAYEAQAYLRDCLESVLSQSIDAWECIVVDDGSRDATYSIAEEYRQRDARFIVLRQENRGQSAARNAGAARAARSSRYYWFLDSDDLLEEHALKRASLYLDRHPDVVTVGVGFRKIDSMGGSLGRGHRSRWVPGRWMPRQLKPKEADTPFVAFFCVTGQGPYALHRAAAFWKTAGYDPSLPSHEDCDLFCQMSLLGRVHYLPEVLYVYRVREGSMTSVGQERGGGERFLEKWLAMQGRDEREARVLEHARAYYMRRHLPFRDLKVGILTIARFPAHRRVSSLRWGFGLVRSGLGALVRRPTDEDQPW